MKPRPSHIVVVEDDPITRAKLVAYFSAEGHRVSEAADGTAMRAIMSSRPVDLLMIDVNLPGEDGFQLTREIRATSDAGIILVTGRTDTVDRIVGLELGADDYVTKPFNQRELVVRVKNLLRRVRSGKPHEELRQVRHFLGWTFDVPHRSLLDPDGRFVELTRAEFKALALLTANPGEVMSRDRLLHEVARRDWHPTDRTVDVIIRRLRRKLGDESGSPRCIVTSHGEGYLFAVTPD